MRPFSTAFLASRPAATITLGLLVFVQLVMAAMTTSPCLRSNSLPFHLIGHAAETGIGGGGRRMGGGFGFDLVAAFAFPAAFGRAVVGGCLP